MPDRSPEAIAAEFPGAADRIYLNTAAEGLGGRTLERSLERYAAAKRRGSDGRAEFTQTEAAAKSRLADRLGCQPADLAFLGSTTDAINTVLRGLPWRPGDNVVITELEFPSAMIACLSLAAQIGIDVRVVPHRDGDIDPAHIIERIDDRTRLVILSHVSFFSGARFDPGPIAQAAHDRGALLLVDASQSLGAVPVSVAGVDFLVSCTFKWLLASHGLGILYVAPARRDLLSGQATGWRGVTDFLGVMHTQTFEPHPDARRFERGMPSYPAVYALRDALAYLDGLGPDWITDRVLAHSATLLEIVRSCGLQPLTPDAPSRRAGIVAFAHPQATAIGHALAERGVTAWCRDGRVRLSAHVYTSEDNVMKLRELLPEILRSRGE